MNISGLGITETCLKINKNFIIDTKLAFDFFELTNGGHGVIDRGVEEDTYKSNITVNGTKEQILQFADEIQSNRTSGSVNDFKNIIILRNLNESEKIFGAEIDYNADLIVTPIIEGRIQRTISTWSVNLELIAQSLVFIEPTLSTFPTIFHISNGSDADFKRSTNKQFSLNNYFWIQEHDFDSGEFSGTVLFSETEMVRAKSFQRINRGNTFDLQILNGIEEVFGIRKKGTMRVKLLEISNEIIIGMNCCQPVWECNVTFSEEFD